MSKLSRKSAEIIHCWTLFKKTTKNFRFPNHTYFTFPNWMSKSWTIIKYHFHDDSLRNEIMMCDGIIVFFKLIKKMKKIHTNHIVLVET